MAVWRTHPPNAILWSAHRDAEVKFSELVQMLEKNGFRLVKEKGSIRYYEKTGHAKIIRVDYHGSKEVPTGTCQAILKAAGLRQRS